MSKLSSRINVSTTESVVDIKYTPKLLIPCEASYQVESSHRFPSFDAIRARKDALNVRLVEEFETAISTAQQVWIIDKHLFSADGQEPDHSIRIQKVVDWFWTDHIETVKILTGYHDSKKKIMDDFEILKQLVTENRAKLAPP